MPHQTNTLANGVWPVFGADWDHYVKASLSRQWWLPGLLRVLSLSILSSLGLGKAVGDDLEYAIKAAYLVKFADFVSWPSGTLSGNEFVICVVGRDPFGALLERASEGQTIHRRPIVLHRYDTLAENPHCDLVYVAGGATGEVLAALQGAPVLTVTDGPQGVANVGIINFVLVDGRVRFDIDQRAAQQSHLVISSKLLGLAVHVRNRTSG